MARDRRILPVRWAVAVSLALLVATLAGMSQKAATAPRPTGPAPPASAFLEPGVLPKAWDASGPNCMQMPA